MGVPPTRGPPGNTDIISTEASAFPAPQHGLSNSGGSIPGFPSPPGLPTGGSNSGSPMPMFPSTPSTPLAPSPPPTLKQPPPAQRGPSYQFPSVPGENSPSPVAPVQPPLAKPAPVIPVNTPAPISAPRATGKVGPTGYKPSLEEQEQAQKYCKFASSALDYDDIANAVSNLVSALKLLAGKEVQL